MQGLTSFKQLRQYCNTLKHSIFYGVLLHSLQDHHHLLLEVGGCNPCINHNQNKHDQLSYRQYIIHKNYQEYHD